MRNIKMCCHVKELFFNATERGNFAPKMVLGHPQRFGVIKE